TPQVCCKNKLLDRATDHMLPNNGTVAGSAPPQQMILPSGEVKHPVAPDDAEKDVALQLPCNRSGNAENAPTVLRPSRSEPLCPAHHTNESTRSMPQVKSSPANSAEYRRVPPPVAGGPSSNTAADVAPVRN